MPTDPVRAADAATESAAKAIAEAFGLNPAPGLDATGRGCWLWALRADGTQEARAATIGEVLSALRDAGFTVVRLPKPDDVDFVPRGVSARYDGVWAGTDGRMQVPGLGWMGAAEGRRTAAALLAAADAIEEPHLPGCDDCPAGCASCTGDTASCECYVHEHVPVSERATSPTDPAGGGS